MTRARRNKKSALRQLQAAEALGFGGASKPPPLSDAARARQAAEAEAARAAELPPSPDLEAAERIRTASTVECAEARDALIREWLMLDTQIRATLWTQGRGDRLPVDEVRSLSPLSKRHTEVLQQLGVVTHRKKASRLSSLMAAREEGGT